MHPYADPAYVAALMPEDGKALPVPAWGNTVLVRPIAKGGYDAAGSYPLMPFAGMSDIPAGLEQLRRHGLVSVSMVPDPLASPDTDRLKRHFGHVKPFKRHLIIEGLKNYNPVKNHRYYIRRGYRRCRIERGPLAGWLNDWQRLYAELVRHRQIRGMADFSSRYFTHLTHIPQLEAFAAFVGEELCGMTLWFAHQGVIYTHLTACNATGYANGVTFALYDAAITHFGERGVINLGGGAGTSGSDDGGLFAFKQGFATGTVTAHICGAILDPEAYEALSRNPVTDFFPAYRG